VVVPAPVNEGRAVRVLVAVPVVTVLALDAAYIAIIRSQGDYQPDVFTVPFVAGYLALMAALLLASLFETAAVIRVRGALRGAAAAGLLVLGFLAIFSIGFPLLIAGALTSAATVLTVAARPVRGALLAAGAGAVVALVVLIAGFEITSRIIVCPQSEAMSGSESGLTSGGFIYECNNGQLTITSR